MTFNEQNTVEQYVISKLTGRSFEGVTDSAQPEYGKTAQWKYVSAEEIGRDEGEIIIETMLKDALIRINPEIRSLPERADEVIYNSGLFCYPCMMLGLFARMRSLLSGFRVIRPCRLAKTISMYR